MLFPAAVLSPFFVARNFGTHWSGSFDGCNEEHGGQPLPQLRQFTSRYAFVFLSEFAIQSTLSPEVSDGT